MRRNIDVASGEPETPVDSAARTLALMLREIELLMEGQAKRYAFRDHRDDLQRLVEFFEAPALIALAAALRRLRAPTDSISTKTGPSLHRVG